MNMHYMTDGRYLSFSRLGKLTFIGFVLMHIYACIPAPPPPQPLPINEFDMGRVSPNMMMDQNLSVPSSTPLDHCEVSSVGTREWTGVVYEIKFGREEPTGVSWGTNIDQRASGVDDPQGCYRADLRSPDGEEGVDNQFAKILPLIEAVGGEAIEGLAQGIINQGRLLMMFQMTALDDPTLQEDDCLHFESFYGAGTPQIGPHGFLVSGQSFDRDLERPSVMNTNLSLNGGELTVTGLELDLPLEVFDQYYLFELKKVLIKGQFTPEGEFHGFVSGALDVEAVAQRVEMIDGGGMVAELIPRFLRQQADLEPNEDGVCQALSMTLTFKAKSAFIYADQEVHHED